MRKITNSEIERFNNYLNDIVKFKFWVGNKELSKKLVLSYKSILCNNYSPSSVNVTISSINCFFDYMKWYDLRVKNLKIQKQIFALTEKELTKEEYIRLLEAAHQRKNERLYLLMQTICSTGIRVSELRYITIEATLSGIAEINCKGKLRQVFLPNKLCQMLRKFANETKIQSGAVFVTKNGIPIDRSNIWSDMKKLCKIANVSQKKVTPHNLRHLFARTYYNVQKDIVHLADILGHSNVNTTRIYTMETGEIHRKQIQKLGLLLNE